MKLVFQSADPELAALRGVALTRVQFAMRRLSWLMPQVRVRLDDINGPRGGIDKRCQVQVRTRDVGTIVVTSLATTAHEALNSALARAVQVVRRTWHRKRRPAAGRATPERSV